MIQKKQKKSQITNKSNVAVYEEKVNHKILIGFILITLLTFMMYKKDLALNNLQWLICHKTKSYIFDIYV